MKPRAKLEPRPKPVGKTELEWQRRSSGLTGAPLDLVMQMIDSNEDLLTEVSSLRAKIEAQGKTLASLRLMMAGTTDSSVTTPAIDARIVKQNSRIAKEFQEMRVGLVSTRASRARAAHEQANISEAVKQSWIADGRLVSSAALAKAWGCSRQALEQAVERGELFNLKISGRRWYPSSMQELDASAVKGVCSALRGLSPAVSFVAWEAKQGSLGGLSLAQAIKAGRSSEATALAEALFVAWA